MPHALHCVVPQPGKCRENHYCCRLHCPVYNNRQCSEQYRRTLASPRGKHHIVEKCTAYSMKYFVCFTADAIGDTARGIFFENAIYCPDRPGVRTLHMLCNPCNGRCAVNRHQPFNRSTKRQSANLGSRARPYHSLYRFSCKCFVLFLQ